MPLLTRKTAIPQRTAVPILAEASFGRESERGSDPGSGKSGSYPPDSYEAVTYESGAVASGRPGSGEVSSVGRLFSRCANTGCSSGWLHLLRSRTSPVFEGGWNCSASCTEDRLRSSIRRELEGRGGGEERHRHRVPLGLLMLEQGWITSIQLRRALEAQKASGGGRLGQWLVRQQGVSEQMVTRALGLQWSCPVLPLEFHDGEGLTPMVPRLFLDAFGALPLRVAAGKLLYLGFENCLDPVLALAMERMTGLRVESGLVQGSLFRPAHERMLNAVFPPVELLEASSEPALVRALGRAVERAKPVDSRLVRVHDCLWLRMWRRPQTGPVPEADMVQDMICTIGSH